MTDMFVHADNGEATTRTSAETSPKAAATTTMETVAGEAADLKQHAGEEVGTVVEAAKEQALSLADEAKSRMKDEANSAASRTASALSESATELTSMASSVDNPGPAARLVQQAGERVDSAAQRLQREGYEGIARDATTWARQNPSLFLLAAAGTGFVLGRVYRSVDTKRVADAGWGSGSASAGSDESSTQALPTAAPTHGTAAGIATVTPSPDAVPSYAPQPHPDASADPVVDLSGLANPPYAADPLVPGGQP